VPSPEIWDRLLAAGWQATEADRWITAKDHRFVVTIRQKAGAGELVRSLLHHGVRPSSKVAGEMVYGGQPVDLALLEDVIAHSDIAQLDPAVLIGALSAGRLDVVRLLLDRGMRINKMGRDEGVTDPMDWEWIVHQGMDKPMPALHWVVEYGKIDAVRLLLDHGALVSIKDGRRWTAVDRANRRSLEDKEEILALVEEAAARAMKELGGRRRIYR
jgi:hypothetical protein